MKFQKFMISLLLIGLQSRYSGCDEPPRVREYDSDVPNIYNGGLKVEQLSEGNEKMAKFADSSRVELSLDQYTDDSYIQAYKLTHENYQNNKEKLSIDVARENRAHLAGFRVKRQAVNKLESEKFQMSEAKIPDEATLEVMRTKKELRNVRSPYEVVENPTKATKSNRMGYRAKVTPRLYSGMPTHRYGLNSDYNRAAQAVNFRKADQPKFGDKLLWNPSELNRYKRLQHRAHQLPVPAPTPVILNNGVAQQTQQIHLPQVNQQAYLDQQQQQQYVATYIPYQDLATIPQAQPTYNQQQYNQVDSQNYNYLYNQFPQYENQQLQQQQFFQANPYGPVELHYDQANTQYASPQKLDGLQVLQSLLGQNPKQQLEGLRELLSKEELYQQQLVQQQQYEQQQLRPQDSTAPIVFHPIAGGQVNQIPVTKSPQYQFTVAGSTKQIVPIPTSTTTFAPHVPTPTTVSPTTIRYQDLLPSSTPAPFSVVTDENPLKLLPAPVQNGPESQNALFHGHQYQITSTPLPLISQHNAISSNSLQNHNQQKAQQHHRQQHDGDNRSEHDANHDLQYASGYAFGYRVRDFHTGNDFGHTQNRDVDGITRGEYHILLPDGRVQNVRYHADDQGFHADVSYETVH